MWSELTLDPSSKVKDGSLALLSWLSGGYKFASVLRCVGLVQLNIKIHNANTTIYKVLKFYSFLNYVQEIKNSLLLHSLESIQVLVHHPTESMSPLYFF